ncbi:MAG: SMP-30/gluconolactonase/LRE family protein [Elusimicrobiaceae bacterium]|nr:SMP-30/gluconolactonase/LRE family protein [Elusimicrobiaceae bacterium]
MKKLILLTMICLIAGVAQAEVPLTGKGEIEDIAGVPGKRAYSGDGSDALKAHFASPMGIAEDRWHNIYIADTLNHRVRRVDVRSGFVDTLAGIDRSGFFNDGGHADMASLKGPTALVFDKFGNLFIADTGNNRIRMVTPKGYIYTVAGDGRRGYNGEGTKATASPLNSPMGLAISPTGEIYIADTGNNRIRRINRSTGLLETVVGTGIPGDDGDDGLAADAQLNKPTAILFDKHGNLFIADTRNHKIRFVDHKSKRIFTIAGDGTEGYKGDNDGRSRDAWFNDPTGLAIDRLGRIYVSDTDNQRIRRITIDVPRRKSYVETVVGNGVRGYNGDDMDSWDVYLAYPGAMYISDWDMLYFVDVGNNVIRRVQDISKVYPPTSYSSYGQPAEETDSRTFYEVLFKPQMEAMQMEK